MSQILMNLKLKFTNKLKINKNKSKKNNNNSTNNENFKDEFKAETIFIRKLCSRSTTYINFNSFGLLKHKIMDFKEF
ncbi:hypothetical protein H8356DRAFT_1378041 [Neocallimastix lanati (nom. inval.)]|nr:hypothetical protein H8356DRAFT_1378041 [Neocallimastix sp. JGI-2020a]